MTMNKDESPLSGKKKKKNNFSTPYQLPPL